MGDEPIVISTGLVVTPESVMSRSFTSAFRGYHPAEVRQFLKRVGGELAASADREVELRRALQDALSRAANPDLDEATVTRVLGEHAARLISNARDTAASITSEAHDHAEAMLREAEARAARICEEAEGVLARRVAEADAATAGVQHSAGAEVQALRERARAEAEAIVEAARAQGREMVTEARALRERMLGDLTRRRRAAQMQVEQLHAARDRLLAAYDVVRRTLDQATAEVTAAAPEARMAAEAVARRFEESDIPVPPAREVPGPPESSERPPASGRPPAAAAPPERPASRQNAPSQERPQTADGAPPSLELRGVEARRPAPASERPPMRPQTVADVAAGRPPAQARPTGRRQAHADPAARQAGPRPLRHPTPSPPPAAGPQAAVPPPRPPAPAESALPAPPSSKVEELFSRLRAERQQVTGPAPASGAPAAAQAPEPPTPVAAAPDAPQAPDPAAGEAALEGRDGLLDNVEAGLTRALKRVLQTEQNEVLDNLRRLGASEAVLPEAAVHLAAYRDAALPWLQQAARAGVGHASDAAPGSDAAVAYPPFDAQAQAQALAAQVGGALRERLLRILAETAGGEDPAVAAEGLRAVYRQWKLQEVEDSARHHALTAFSVAAFAATDRDTLLRWVVDDDGHCPDCDDNALAGPTPKGQPFPTGQLHPPAHRGCRCMLTPVGP